MTRSDGESNATSSFDWLFKDDLQDLSVEQRQALVRYRTQRISQQLLPMDVEEQINALIILLDPKNAELREEMQMVSLYLRPFNVDYNFYYSYGGNEKFLEHSLNDLLGDVAPVFGFDAGNVPEFDPSNKGTRSLFSTNAQWQDEVRAAIEICAPIFVLPSGDPGILWEIRQLQRMNSLAKTIFIMPATTTHRSRRTSEEFWSDAQRAFRKEFGEELPRFSRRGAWFTMGDDLRVKRIAFDFANLFNLSQGQLPPSVPQVALDSTHVAAALRDLLCEDGKLGIAWSEEEWNRRLNADEADFKSLFEEHDSKSSKKAAIAILHGLEVGEFTMEDFQNGSPETRRRVLTRVKELDRDISSGKVKPKVTERDLAGLGRDRPRPPEQPKEASAWTIISWIIFGFMLLAAFSSG